MFFDTMGLGLVLAEGGGVRGTDGDVDGMASTTVRWDMIGRGVRIEATVV
ncbi:hypothetical protein ACTWPT_55040 [Nonomuraea sp. 3N208]